MVTGKKVKPASKSEFDTRASIETRDPVLPKPGEEELFESLRKYQQMAIDLGAVKADIIPVSEFPQDIRIWWKCQIPRCVTSGANAYCPPQWKTPWKDAKQIKNSYKYCIVFQTVRLPEFWTGPHYIHVVNNAVVAKYLPPQRKEAALTELRDWNKWLTDYKKEYKNIPKDKRPKGTASIGPRIVERARKEGHDFAVTFGVGSCQQSRCSKHGATCVAMTTGYCRYPRQASPEGSAALYQDFYTLSAKMGWNTKVSGYSVWPEDAKDSEYTQFGTVFIG